MKILAIRGKNLASLESFDVGLESGPLAHVGIFAITGPTGAGKTTLLDALCVALFDRTPRLSNLAGVPVGTADQEDSHRVRANDVRGLLRRGAGEGFAEVDFVGRDDRAYRARWSVHRSRRRATGKLQDSEISLTDIEVGQVFAGKKRETLEAIEGKLGLSFEQFRRSALLAQNDFATFLRANKEQRSDLLERMTGTEIYTKLSVAAFRRAALEAKELTTLEEAADASAILDDEHRQALTVKRDGLRKEYKEQQVSLQKAHATVQWFCDSRKAIEALDEAGRIRSEAQEVLKGLKGTVERIASVRSAREQRGLVDAAAEAREQAEQAMRQHKRAGEERAKAKTKSEQLAALSKKAKAEVETARARYIAVLDSESSQNTKCIGQLASWLGEHAELAALGGEHLEFTALAPEALDALRPELEESAAEHGRRAEGARKQELLMLEIRNKATTVSTALAEQSLASKLGDLRSADARMAKQELGVRRLQTLVAARDRAAELQARAEEHGQAAAVAIERLALEARDNAKLEIVCAAALSEAQAAYDRIRLALDLTEHRANLAEGEHCPLCGSIEHPWRENDATVGIVDEQEARVAELRGEQEACRKRAAEIATQHNAQEHAHKKSAEEVTLQQTEIASAQREAAEDEKQEFLAVLKLSLEESSLAGGLLSLEREHARMRESLLEAEALDVKAREASALEIKASSDWAAASEERQVAESGHQEAVSKLSACQGYRYRSRVTQLARFRSAQAVCEEKRASAPSWTPEEEQRALAEAIKAEQAASEALAAVVAEVGASAARSEESEQVAVESVNRRREMLERLGCTLEALSERLDVADDWLASAEASVELANRNVAQAEGSLQERALRSAEVEGKRPEASSESDALKQHENTAERGEALAEEGVRVEAELRADEEARGHRDELGEKISKTVERVRVFRTLSDLIGSADGKKLRVFAQSLTLESLLAGANRHLKDLAPRYLLERVPGHDLDLQVIDRDLADEVRSVNSLSGGESFLISLALALGLSSLASQDVRVESLLVDEGFGSLDGDTLEVALSVLDSLQATGRKVGLISHVPGFAERIGAQVIVTPQGGGRSTVRVQGPTNYR
ncbi:MAG: AAA family ATPase [Myxococcales bacterium]|nr:AAA family ATPase [Myxococcales bacterium]